jgi:hypothetical protein
MAFKAFHRVLERSVAVIHLQRVLATLRQAEHPVAEWQVPRSPHWIGKNDTIHRFDSRVLCRSAIRR